MKFNPASEVYDFLVFGEYGDVNPSICDSATYTFLEAKTMEGVFEGEVEGCFLYSRQFNPTCYYLSGALAKMEGGEAALVFSSGMAAISSAILQICASGDEIISSRTIYGGTYALLANLLPKFGIKTHFLDLNDLELVKKTLNGKTKIIYTESLSNPLLEVADIEKLAKISQANNLKLLVDNTFTPMIFSPLKLGADIVLYSMTKFINGASDCVAGALIANSEFTNSMIDVNSGISMLLGPVLDSARAASILKNLRTLHCRMQLHSKNATILAEFFEKKGLKTFYPGLKSHQGFKLFQKHMHPDYGFGGMLTVDLKTKEKANDFMVKMQNEKVGYLAVSLGYYKTLFSAPGNSTSSEIPADKREQMGLSDGLVRMSVGLHSNMADICQRIDKALS